ncbi:MAG: hypothetical protein BWY64_02833 [bacterium ADurb.Bin363]|nr:MAG: hypothetical protein BWY64_02833 [bacterium ADurb.Bin363]
MEKLIVSQVVGGSQVIDGETSYCLIRASKYQKEDKSIFYRVSVIKDSATIEYMDYTNTVEECAKLFIDFQKQYLSKIEKQLNMTEFV